MMDNHNWRPSPAPQGVGGGAGAPGPVPGGVGGGDAPATDAVDWRSELSAESRDRIVSKIMETLKKHLPVSGPDGLSELKKIAVRFEEKIYHVASSQPDYLRKISMKMLTNRNNIDSDGIQRGAHDDGSMSGRGGLLGLYLEKQHPVEPPKNNEEIDLSLKL